MSPTYDYVDAALSQILWISKKHLSSEELGKVTAALDVICEELRRLEKGDVDVV